MIVNTPNRYGSLDMLDLSLLSEHAKGELLDFYQFLLDRYGQQQRLRHLPETFYQPVKTRVYHPFDREAIYYDR